MAPRILDALTLGACLSFGWLSSCQSPSDESCTPGSQSCECSNGQCLGGLVCTHGVCLQSTTPTTTGTATAGEDATAETAAPPATGSTDAVDSSDGANTTEGPGGCQGTDGTVGCPCLAGNECLGDLECDSEQTCICLSGTPCGGTDCVDDFMTDSRHCGSCDNECSVFGSAIGHCEAGACSATLSSCAPYVDGMTCNAVCATDGTTCVARGCGSEGSMLSWYGYWPKSTCEVHDTPQTFGLHDCDEPLVDQVEAALVRCCCTAM